VLVAALRFVCCRCLFFQFCAWYEYCCFVYYCLTDRPACCSLLVGDVYGGPGCIGWGLQQCCLFIHCWPVVIHLFVSGPGLPELTAVIWAACVLHLCTVQVPCYDVERSLPYISKPGGRVLAAPPPPGGGLLLTYCCACCVCVLFQVIPCVLRSFFAWPGAIFLRAGLFWLLFTCMHKHCYCHEGHWSIEHRNSAVSFIALD
jgi:hypothetical protein